MYVNVNVNDDEYVAVYVCEKYILKNIYVDVCVKNNKDEYVIDYIYEYVNVAGCYFVNIKMFVMEMIRSRC
jgi:hypothetical protein